MIETDRLILRRPLPKDADGYVDFLMSDRAKHVAQARHRHTAWIHFAGEIGHWEIRGWGMFAVTRKGDDACIGVVGPFYPDGWPENELGWLIWPEAEGQGLAHEAAVAARSYAYDTLGWDTAVSYIDPPNARSIALAERLGCVPDDAAARPKDLGDQACHVYRHPSPAALRGER